jgi:hypothetical protein
MRRPREISSTHFHLSRPFCHCFPHPEKWLGPRLKLDCDNLITDRLRLVLLRLQKGRWATHSILTFSPISGVAQPSSNIDEPLSVRQRHGHGRNQGMPDASGAGVVPPFTYAVTRRFGSGQNRGRSMMESLRRRARQLRRTTSDVGAR